MQQVRISLKKAIRKTPPVLSFLSALLLFALGVLLLMDYELVLRYAAWAVLALIALSGLGTVIHLLRTESKRSALVAALLYLLAGVGFFLFPQFLGLSAARLFGLWMVLQGVIRGMICVQCILERLRGVLRHGLYAVFSVGFGLSLFLQPETNIGGLMALAGLCFLLMGVMALLDALSEAFNARDEGRIRRRPRLALPVLISAFLPKRAIDRFNALMVFSEDFEERPSIKSGDLEILVHVAEKGVEMFGHVDISYHGKIYSYGAYDGHASILMGAISDGVFIVADREPYLQHRLRSGEELMTGFTVDLNAQQEEIIRQRLEELFSRLVPWQCDARKAELGLVPDAEYSDHASRLYRETGAGMYKVAKGKFKRYFLFSTNCVALADYLVGASGLDMKGIHGIITPGSYYSLLDDMFRRGNTMVTAKNIYRDVPMGAEAGMSRIKS